MKQVTKRITKSESISIPAGITSIIVSSIILNNNYEDIGTTQGSGTSLVKCKNKWAKFWGDNTSANGGIGNTAAQSRPIITFLQGYVDKVSSGAAHSLALDINGKAWGWGNNGSGRVGNNNTVLQSLPVSVHQGALTFTQISAGSAHSLAIDTNGEIWAWGDGGSGRLGINAVVPRSIPTVVYQPLMISYTKISAGHDYSLALDSLGQAWAWGANNAGKLGNNSIVSVSAPVTVDQGTLTFTQISAGNSHSMALDSLGQAWAWGIATRLGNGDDVNDRSVPVSVHQGALTFTQIAAGANHCLALDTNGQVWGWGTNNTAQLGNNSIVSTSVPVSVHQGTVEFAQIGAGSGYSLAIDTNGQAWAWGAGTLGRLGNNLAVDVSIPVLVHPNSNSLIHSEAMTKNLDAFVAILNVTPNTTYEVTIKPLDGIWFGEYFIGFGEGLEVRWFI
jgi:alpha-tubulin suppressor-like RCC1 family protein